MTTIVGTPPNEENAVKTLPWPQSTICQVLAYTHDGKAFKGTGCVLPNNLVITAAHNVAGEHFDYQLPSRVYLYAGWIGNDYDRRFTVNDPEENVFVHPDFPDNSQRDIALLRPQGVISDYTGSMGIKAADDGELDFKVNPVEWDLHGFPLGGALRLYPGVLSVIETLAFRHSATDTQKGVSGGPVWRRENNGPTMVGVHYREDEATHTDACRITKDDMTWVLNIEG